MAREVFIGEGDGKERWVKGGSAEVREREGRMIPFVVWMCVMKVHGDRLSEEERANRA
ncbi:hypothetical protein BC829DRAFT_393523 [Chytridium lagenaria]|nr:hypothetical protein BC829DRAFT_393523 [Chytridium lagenaria]